MALPGRPVGVIYGNVGSTQFEIAVSDVSLKRLDYVEAEHNGARVLGTVTRVVRHSDLSYEEALAGTGAGAQDRLSAKVRVVGYRDANNRVQVPRTPFAAGSTVRAADEDLITRTIGLSQGGAYLGHVKGLDVPVNLNLNTLAQKHLSVLAKTGAGKSYTVGVILEEFLRNKVPLVILDPHGEYGSLRHPNIEDREIKQMVRFGVKPKAFQNQIQEYAIDTRLNPEAEPLRLEGVNLEAREILDILPAKLSGGQVGVLYQAVKDVQEHHPAYTLQDVVEAVSMNKSSAKWNVLNALEALQATKLFHVRGTPIKDLVRPGRCTIINLKGVSPDIQEVVAGRIGALLWEARKREAVPPHILVVEEAHNFCPERGVGNAVSGAVLRTVASEGRKFGMGLVIVSQRPAKIDKNVLSQCNTQIVLKVTNPNDLKAIISSVEGISSDSADEIQRLSVGVGMVAGGGLTQPVLVDVRPRLTRHGGASIDVVGKKKPKDLKFVASEPAPLPPPAPAPERVEPVPAFEPQPEPASTPPPIMAAPPPVPATAPATAPASMDPEPPSFLIDDDPVTHAVRGAHTRRRPVAPKPRPPVKRAPGPAPTAPLAINPETPPAPSPPAMPPPPAPMAKPTQRSGADKQDIQRVAQRLGIVIHDDADLTLRFLAQNPPMPELSPDAAIDRMLDIARVACHDDTPVCIRCPMRDTCQFHLDAQQQRQKDRGGLRRLWRRN